MNPTASSLYWTAHETIKRIFENGGRRTYENNFGKTNWLYCDHHLAHAISSYVFGGLPEAIVVVFDGRGRTESTSIWLGQDGRLTPIEILKWPNSLGLLYAKFTAYLGFKPMSDEWKVMGLAAYGEPEISMKSFIDLSSDPYQVNLYNVHGRNFRDLSRLEAELGPRRKPGEELTDNHRNIAFALQAAIEQAMVQTVRRAIRITGIRNVCLAGGVALNAKANAIISELPIVDNLFVQPASSDEGCALGAALFPLAHAGAKLPVTDLRDVFLGPEYTESDICSVLRSYKLDYETLNGNVQPIAEDLLEGKIVGLFQGRMEFGPRALGHRSIIADPRFSRMRDLINSAVKFREPWRPFAPAILENCYHEYINSENVSPFMVAAYPVWEMKRNDLKAAMHIDCTARVQAVSKQHNGHFYRVIEAFYRSGGVPAVLNTSFNLSGEPIVCTPTDAVRSFYSSGMDTLVIGDFIIRK